MHNTYCHYTEYIHIAAFLYCDILWHNNYMCVDCYHGVLRSIKAYCLIVLSAYQSMCGFKWWLIYLTCQSSLLRPHYWLPREVPRPSFTSDLHLPRSLTTSTQLNASEPATQIKTGRASEKFLKAIKGRVDVRLEKYHRTNRNIIGALRHLRNACGCITTFKC